MLRGSWGDGFRAPNMVDLYRPAISGSTSAIDSYRCSLTDEDADGDGRSDVDLDLLPPWHPCQKTSHEGTRGGNRDLDPEESRNWTVGFVWSPTEDLSLMTDYYDVEIDNQIYMSNAQRVLDEELRLRQAGATGNVVGNVTRTREGRTRLVRVQKENLWQVETSGIDVEAGYSFSAGRFGDLSTTARWTHVIEYVETTDEGQFDWAGKYSAPQDRVRLTFNWSLGDYSATVVGNYVSDQDGLPDDPALEMDSFTTWDVQLAYSTPWNGQITLGARNVFDEDPPQYGWGSGYDLYQHEVYGRVPYLRLKQSF